MQRDVHCMLSTLQSHMTFKEFILNLNIRYFEVILIFSSLVIGSALFLFTLNCCAKLRLVLYCAVLYIPFDLYFLRLISRWISFTAKHEVNIKRFSYVLLYR